MTSLSLHKISKHFGKTIVVNDLDLDIRPGEFLALVGPSGCGKSTILRMVAGLEPPTSGEVRLDGKCVNDLGPKERGVAMVFQNYALYPHMTVRENMSFGLKLSGVTKVEWNKKVEEAADVLRVSAYLDKKPGQLSGGQKQRVAMGRAMVRNPKLFLFDEPLSNLDAALRVKMRSEIADLHKRLGCTTVYVTHDQVEAMTLADRIAVLNGGKIEQLAAPMELYQHPKTKFVASFIGMPPMNILPCDTASALGTPTDAEQVGVRPEDTVVKERNEGIGDMVSLGEGVIKLVEPLGGNCHVHVELVSKAIVMSEAKYSPQIHAGQNVKVCAPRRALYFFNSSGVTLFAAGKI